MARARAILKPGKGSATAKAQELRILRAFVERAPMAVLMLDRRMRGIQVSQRWLDDVGMTRDYVLGRSHYECFPDLPAHWKGLHRRGLAGESLSGHEEKYFTPDGEEHWVNWQITPWGDSGESTGGILISSDDVTEQKCAEEEVQRSASTIRTLLESAPQSVIVVSAEAMIVFANQTTETMFGYAPKELLGQPLDILIPEGLRGHHAAHHKDYFANMELRPKAVSLNLEGLHKNGTTFPVEIDLSGIETDTGKLAVAFVSDVTQRKQSERMAYAQLQADLNKQRLETVGMLAEGIAHDFNNLLAGVLAHSELALAELEIGSNPEGELKDICKAAIRGGEIVRQLMIYSGQESDELEAVNVSEVVEDMIELLKVSVSKQVTIESDLPAFLPAVRATPSQIRQVAMNLITNASEAIGEREGVIRVATRQVMVGSDSSLATSERMSAGNYVELEVADSGSGITPELKTRIFEPFFTTKATGGHGHGLVVVKRIVERLHGTIRLSTTPSKGATFQIFLPCEVFRAHPSSIPSAQSLEEALGVRQATILFVEDETALREPLSKVLQKKGLSVIGVSDGSAALDVIRSQTDHVDLLILDLTLPGASSRDVYEETKRLRPDLPVIIISAKSAETSAASLGAGIERFLRKPFRVGDLSEMIQVTLSSERAQCLSTTPEAR